MQVYINKGMVHLIATNAKESHKLHDLSKSFLSVLEVSEKSPEKSPKVRKHKKHNHIKTCVFCGKGYKGAIGLGIHKAKCPKRIIASSTALSKVYATSSSSGV